MKKTLILTAAILLTVVACTKVTPAGDLRNEISFQVANSVQTKADASPVKFTNTDFGAFSWHHAEDGTVTAFMENEQVGQKDNVWKTLNSTYYWPKTGSLNFVSYSPYMATGGPVVSEKSIAFTGYTVSGEDLMYADKANGKTENEEAYDANGVPTLFHHALAKLSFKVKANFLEFTADDNNKSKTTWAVTLQKATIKGLYNTGDLVLNIADDDVTWETDGWKADATKTAKDLELVTAANGVALTTEAQDLYGAASFYVLPQTLAGKAQQLDLTIHIKTSLPNGNVLEEDYTKTLDIKDISTLSAWGMNQNIIYTICIKPTSVFDPNNPDTPEDAVITFDPAQMDWVTVDTEAQIQL